MAGNGKLVTVFGGSGFVGRHVVSALARRGYRVRAAVRRPDIAGYLQPMGVVGQIYAVQANLRFPDSLARAVEGAHTVVNAVGILAPSGAQTFSAIHAEGAKAVAAAAKAAGAERLVHISAIGADAKSRSRYARSKAEGERLTLAAFPEAIILRPSIVFGPEDEFFNRFARLARLSPFLPLIGGGATKFQPVYVGDLAAAVANAAEGAGAPGETYEIGGPQVFTFRQLLDMTLEYVGRRRAYLPLPFWLATLQAIATWPLPNSIRPITIDQVRLLKRDTIVSDVAKAEKRTLAALGVDPAMAVSAIAPGYLEPYKPRGQYARYRA